MIGPGRPGASTTPRSSSQPPRTPPSRRRPNTSRSAWCACRLARTSGPTWRQPAGRSAGNTIALVGSAPSFPHGTIDPIEELSELARQRRHRLPHRRLPGRICPALGQAAGLPGAALRFLPARGDLHLGRHAQVRLRRQGHFGDPVPAQGAARITSTYTANDWPGGLYCSPTFAGSRPGALSAACWAAMVSMGESGYLEAARRILETAAWLRQEIAPHPGAAPAGRFALRAGLRLAGRWISTACWKRWGRGIGT